MQTSDTSLWYKDAVFYNLSVRAFYDSNGDGIGDLAGLIERLDYLEDLGVDALVLLPFYASPLRDDGYDVSDHRAIHPDYGDLATFQRLVTEAHARQLRIIIDVVTNQTSTNHAWFERARRAAPGTAERDFYVWTTDTDQHREVPILFPDAESSNWRWDPVAESYYWHRFYHHQADLNYGNPAVLSALHDTLQYWLDQGVDGFRLTGLHYLYQPAEMALKAVPGPNAGALSVLQQLRSWLGTHSPSSILIADTDQWPETAADYFGPGNGCHLNQHYALTPRLYTALLTESAFPIRDIIAQTPAVPERSQWLLFLRTHDDVALNVVTDEERDLLLRSLAPDPAARLRGGIVRRLAPLLGNDRRKLELLHFLIFTLPGSPLLQYGDEIGMGDNIYLADRRGIRTPMQWSDDRNAGFSTANPQRLYLPVVQDPLYRHETVNVANQTNNAASLWWWIKNTLALRRRHRALSRGSLEWVASPNPKVLAWLRTTEEERLLVVVNLSQYAQPVALSLSAYAGRQPLEVTSQTRFMPIEADTPYGLTLAPYGYYLLALDEATEQDHPSQDQGLEELSVAVGWTSLFDDYRSRRMLERRILPSYLRTCRWFTSKGRKLVNLEVSRALPVATESSLCYWLNLHLRYADGPDEDYSLPVAFVNSAERVVSYLKREPGSVICHLELMGEEGILIDAIYMDDFRDELFWLMKQDTTLTAPSNRLRLESGSILQYLAMQRAEVDGRLLRAEQSNTSIIYNDDYFFKLYRKLDTDINPDLELVRFLSERTDFRHCPRYGGGIELTDTVTHSFTNLGLLQNKIPNHGEAWTLMLSFLERYYHQALLHTGQELPPLRKVTTFGEIPDPVATLLSESVYERAALLGQRTAEMHIALATDWEDPDFRPEPFTLHYQRSLYSAYRKLVHDKLSPLRQRLDDLPPAAATEARAVVDRYEEIMQAFRAIYSQRINAYKTRVHGDYHLGQVLYDDTDFYIIDFEGEPLLSISERRLKRTPFKDVAGMIRSFHYAAMGQLRLSNDYRADDLAHLEQWGRQWYHYVRQAFLNRYLATVQGQPFLPPTLEEQQLLLQVYTLEKAIYEVGYELNSRPDWLRIPLRGVLDALGE